MDFSTLPANLSASINKNFILLMHGASVAYREGFLLGSVNSPPIQCNNS